MGRVIDSGRQRGFLMHFPTEYLLVARERYARPFSVTWRDGKGAAVAGAPILLGFQPVLFGGRTGTDVPGDSVLSFSFEGQEVASLELDTVFSRDGFFVARATGGRNRLLSPGRTLLDALRESLRRNPRRTANPLSASYRRVIAAYCIPRTVGLCVTGDGRRFNLFPADLHGADGDDGYVFSFRQGSPAAGQVRASGRMIVGDAPVSFASRIMETAKNHTAPLRPKEELPFSKLASPAFGWPLPPCVRYAELELDNIVPLGFHSLYFFRLRHGGTASDEDSLAYLHRHAAEWRRKHGIPTETLNA